MSTSARVTTVAAILLLAGCGQQERLPGIRDAYRFAATGDEVVAFVVGSGSCGFCMSDSLRDVGSHLRSAFAPALADVGVRFTVVGVAADGEGRVAARFLTHAGDFDEISAGRAWHNTMLQQVLRNSDASFALSVPTVVLLSRHTDETHRDAVARFGTGRIVLQGVAEVARLLRERRLLDSTIALVRPRP